MNSLWTRWMCVLVAGSLFFAVLPDQGMAQTVSAGTSSSSSDDSNDEYVIGFAIVAVALLLILGVRSDLEKYRESRTQAQLTEYAQAESWSVKEEIIQDFESGW